MTNCIGKMVRVLLLSTIMVMLLAGFASAAEPQQAVAVGATTGSSLRLREEPSTSASVVTTLNKGVAVAILDHTSTDGWFKISYNGKIGYVSSDYMVVDKDNVFTTYGRTNTDSVNVTDIAVLCTERELPHEAVRVLYENQVEFNYLERSLLEQVTIENGYARIAKQAYRVILTDRDFDPKTTDFLTRFRTSGGVVTDRREYGTDADFLAAIRGESRALLQIEASEHLRMTHIRKYGVDVVFLSNEGEEPLSATVHERVAEVWDSESGTRTPHNAEALTITLAPRKSVHLILE